MSEPRWRIVQADLRTADLVQLVGSGYHAVLCDPPYGLSPDGKARTWDDLDGADGRGFMGKAWDAAVPGATFWRSVRRCLRPGAHLLAFGGTRTYHRLVCGIEDAGLEVRDQLAWLYGSGFPKSHDVSKAIDRQRDDLADIYRVTAWVRAARDAAGIGNRDIDEAFGFAGMAGHWTSAKSQPAVPTLEQVPTLLDVLGLTLDDVPDDIRRLLWDLNGRKGQPGENWWKREVVGTSTSTTLEVAPGEGRERPQVVVDITSPATDAARQWEGWGTALKPAHEPIVLAREPLDGTVAHNALTHGCGGLAIDASRVAGPKPATGRGAGGQNGRCCPIGKPGTVERIEDDGAGRWPANVLLDEAAAEMLDERDTGGASRFFYIAKANRSEREAGCETANHHPTVKPIELATYLARMLLPPPGPEPRRILVPFGGSGSEMIGAVLAGWDEVVGVEMSQEYIAIATARLKHWAKRKAPKKKTTKPQPLRRSMPAQMEMF